MPLWKAWQNVTSPSVPAVHQFRRLQEIAAGALHGARLHDALVFAGGLHHLGAFFDIDAGGLFDVDVLAGFAGFDGHVGVPVVGRGDADGVEGFIGDDVAEIFDEFGFEASAARGGLGAFEVRLVDIAKGGGLDFRDLHGIAEVAGAHGAEADEADGDAVIRAFDAAGEEGGGEGGGGRCEDFPSCSWLCSLFPFYWW